jgi:hypothetical protein
LILNAKQCGFRQGYCTMDNIFMLYTFLNFWNEKRKNYTVPL